MDGIGPPAAGCFAGRNPQSGAHLQSAESCRSVDTGKIADLVLLNAKPLNDISNVRKIEAVVLNGRYFDRQALDALVPNFQ